MPMSKEMTPDEQVVLHIRTHGKALIWPVVALLVLTSALGIGIALLPDHWQPWGIGVLVVVYALLVAWMVIWPFMKWFTTTYTVTTRRVMTRHGILTKRGHDLPLRRVNNVNSERSVTDRMLGCGTLVLETAAGQPLTLPDVPKVLDAQSAINTLLLAEEDDDHHE